jgi:hypothetical protein
MKSHFISLFDPSHRWITMSYFIASIILITLSQIIGTTDNIPGLLALFVGMILLFFAFVHPWRNRRNYIVMASLFSGFLVLLFLTMVVLAETGNAKYIDQYLGEAAGIIITFLICIPGITVGILGNIYLKRMNKSH